MIILESVDVNAVKDRNAREIVKTVSRNLRLIYTLIIRLITCFFCTCKIL